MSDCKERRAKLQGELQALDKNIAAAIAQSEATIAPLNKRRAEVAGAIALLTKAINEPGALRAAGLDTPQEAPK